VAWVVIGNFAVTGLAAPVKTDTNADGPLAFLPTDRTPHGIIGQIHRAALLNFDFTLCTAVYVNSHDVFLLPQIASCQIIDTGYHLRTCGNDTRYQLELQVTTLLTESGEAVCLS